jgi:hypothetical protein
MIPKQFTLIVENISQSWRGLVDVQIRSVQYSCTARDKRGAVEIIINFRYMESCMEDS